MGGGCPPHFLEQKNPLEKKRILEKSGVFDGFPQGRLDMFVSQDIEEQLPEELKLACMFLDSFYAGLESKNNKYTYMYVLHVYSIHLHYVCSTYTHLPMDFF